MAKEVSSWKKLAVSSSHARRSLGTLMADAERRGKNAADAISAHKAVEAELAAWEKEGPALIYRLRTLLQALDTDRALQSDTLEQRLARHLTQEGRSVFGESSLLVVDGIVHINVDAVGGRVHINEVQSDELDVEAIAARVSDEIARLTRLLTPPAELIRALLEAYGREVRATGAMVGSQVHTTSLAVQLALRRQPTAFLSDPATRHYREYPRAQFRADLYTLFASHETKVKGHTLRFAAGADTGGAIFMLVPSLGRMAHVGRMWFEREGDPQ